MDETALRVHRALEELATLPSSAVEQSILALLQAVEGGDLPLSSLLGYGPDDLYGFYEKAFLFHQSGRPKSAVAICEGLLALNPGIFAARLLLASCFVDLKEFSKVLEHVDFVLYYQPENLEALLKKAFAHHRLGQSAEAVATIEQLLQYDPGAQTQEGVSARRMLDHLRRLAS